MPDNNYEKSVTLHVKVSIKQQGREQSARDWTEEGLQCVLLCWSLING